MTRPHVDLHTPAVIPRHVRPKLIAARRRHGEVRELAVPRLRGEPMNAAKGRHRESCCHERAEEEFAPATQPLSLRLEGSSAGGP